MTKNRTTSAPRRRAMAMLRRRRSLCTRSSSAMVSRPSSRRQRRKRRQSQQPLDHERGEEHEKVQHRHAGARVIVGAVKRERPEMRRRPEKHDQDENERGETKRSRRRGPADRRRERAGKPADDDVLRRAALQPEGVHKNIERDRETE